MKAGFIGLGLMGSRMAANLLKGGHELIVYNRTASKAESLINMGAIPAALPVDTAKDTDVLFTMMSTPEAVKSAALSVNGFLGGASKKLIWVDCSTVNPSFTKWMANAAAEKGVRFIDAPVSGTTIPAEKGELIFFAGGNESDIEEVTPLLNLMGKKIIHAGKTGMGTSLKMINNLMLAMVMESFSEALLLGESLGFTKEKLFEMLAGSPVAAPMLAGKKDNIINNNFDAQFPLQWMYKDMQLVALTAYENNIPLPSANVVKELYALAAKEGLGEMDFSAIYKFLNK
jgi:3-hydroxyisobutyrate dehydrogenase/glyoxylate/succinic semialdehyde reductase